MNELMEINECESSSRACFSIRFFQEEKIRVLPQRLLYVSIEIKMRMDDKQKYYR